MATIPRVLHAKMQIDCHCICDILYSLLLLEHFVLLVFFMSNNNNPSPPFYAEKPRDSYLYIFLFAF